MPAIGEEAAEAAEGENSSIGALAGASDAATGTGAALVTMDTRGTSDAISGADGYLLPAGTTDVPRSTLVTRDSTGTASVRGPGLVATVVGGGSGRKEEEDAAACAAARNSSRQEQQHLRRRLLLFLETAAERQVRYIQCIQFSLGQHSDSIS